MQLIFHGHACFEIRLEDGTVLLVDPWITDNPQSDLDLNVKCDYILVTHGHFDHSGDMIELSRRNDAPIIAAPELVQFAEAHGAVAGHPLNIGGQWQFDFGTVKMTHAQHSSSLNVDGVNVYLGEAAGFLLFIEDKVIYFSGDTSSFGDMALFANYEIDVAILPIGDNFTMGPKAAAGAAKRLDAHYVIPEHYNTFPMIEQDPEKFKNLLPVGMVQILAPGENFAI